MSDKGVPALRGYLEKDWIDRIGPFLLEVDASDQVSQKAPCEDEHQHVRSLKAAIANRRCSGLDKRQRKLSLRVSRDATESCGVATGIWGCAWVGPGLVRAPQFEQRIRNGLAVSIEDLAVNFNRIRGQFVDWYLTDQAVKPDAEIRTHCL